MEPRFRATQKPHPIKRIGTITAPNPILIFIRDQVDIKHEIILPLRIITAQEKLFTQEPGEVNIITTVMATKLMFLKGSRTKK